MGACTANRYSIRKETLGNVGTGLPAVKLTVGVISNTPVKEKGS